MFGSISNIFLQEDKKKKEEDEDAPQFFTGLGTELDFKLSQLEKSDPFFNIEQRTGGSFNIPKVDINTGGGSEEEKDTISKATEEEQPDSKVPGMNFPKVDLSLPDIDAGVPFIDIEGIKLPTNIKAPTLNIDLPNVILPDLNIDSELPNDTVNAIRDMVEPVAQTVSEVIEPVAKTTIDVARDIAEGLGEGAERVNEISKSLELRSGDGSQYGEISVGKDPFGNNLVVDTSKALDETFKGFTAGTVLEGVSGRDLDSVVNNPKQFITDKSADVTTSVLVNNLGMDAGLAGNVVQALTDPSQLAKTSAVDIISNASGIDAGAVGTIANIASAKDVGQAAEIVVKKAASDTVINVVAGAANAIIPGAGIVVTVLANLFHYSCYLATAAYVGGMIDRKEYLMFPRYRMKVQKKEFMSEKMWLGYLIFFKPIFKLQIKYPMLNTIVTRLLTKPWLKHINYITGNGSFSLTSKLALTFLKSVSIITYFVFYFKAQRIKFELKDLNIMLFYKKVVNSVERGACYVA